MRIRLVTGSVPPEVCGVGDYTWRLAEAIRSKGLDVDISVVKRFFSSEASEVLRGRQGKGEIVHIQYPTLGAGYGMASQALSILRPCVVTLHEFSRVHWLRRVASLPFLLRSHLIFTSQFERGHAARILPPIEGRSDIIPIGSNIAPCAADSSDVRSEIVYFGLLAPKKGLECVLQLASSLRVRGDGTPVRIIGATVPKFQAFADAFISRCAENSILLSLNETPGRVADLFAKARCAYLPFPDGASDRRGSLRALLAAGVPCITTAGRETAEEVRNIVCFADSPDAAALLVEKLFRDECYWRDLSHRSAKYAETFSWCAIAESHLRLYTRFLRTLHGGN